jgi:2-keto-4-pentenoate hydratase/2-oxohepta-3-ene-1,7-dioic acid hydratase in catechol pathway
MKLVRFSTGGASPKFGVVIGDRAVAFSSLQRARGVSHPALTDSRTYLAALPASEAAARELMQWGEAHLHTLADDERPAVTAVRLHEPVEVAGLFDFGLTPRHLANSAETLLRYEQDDPQPTALIRALQQTLARPKVPSAPCRPERLSYYKCNMNSIVGDGVTVPWPLYTARLDIEPELAVVYGNVDQPVAGYCIFNDVSARDVQAPEIVGGFCLAKDMANSNQLGPWLATADEVGDPYSLSVDVRVNGVTRYRGSTAEVSHTAEQAFHWLGLICPLQSGAVIGMGTIPDCTGLDHDDFVDPGAEIAISFARLGTLSCRFAEPLGHLQPSRWPVRDAILKYVR